MTAAGGKFPCTAFNTDPGLAKSLRAIRDQLCGASPGSNHCQVEQLPGESVLNTVKLNQWLTLGANLGVLAGLLLLVVELNQNHEMMRSQTSCARMRYCVTGRMSIISIVLACTMPWSSASKKKPGKRHYPAASAFATIGARFASCTHPSSWRKWTC